MKQNKKCQVLAATSFLLFGLFVGVEVYSQDQGSELLSFKPTGRESSLYDSDLFDRINNELDKVRQGELDSQIRRIEDHNHSFSLGNYNRNGITWHKLFGTFGIWVERELHPTQDSNRWSVHDSLHIMVEAKSFLEKLRADGSLEIEDTALNLFANVMFKRTYKSVHFSESYELGLRKPFNKLFTTALLIESPAMFDVGPREMVSKDDAFHFKAGGLVTVPLYHFLSLQAGFLAAFSKIDRTEVYGPDRTQGFLQWTVLKQKHKLNSHEFSLRLLADVYKVLSITLFRIDLRRALEEELEASVGLRLEDRGNFLENIDKRQALLNFLRAGEVSQSLEPHLQSYMQGTSREKGKSMEVLIFGKRQRERQSSFRYFTPMGVEEESSSQFSLESFTRSPLDFVLNSFEGVQKYLILPFKPYNSHKVQVTLNYQKANERHAIRNFTLEIEQDVILGSSKHLLSEKQKAPLLIPIYQAGAVKEEIVAGFEENILLNPAQYQARWKISKSGYDYFWNLQKEELEYILYSQCEALDHQWDYFQGRKCRSKNVDLVELFFQFVNTEEEDTKVEAAYRFTKEISSRGPQEIFFKQLFGVNNVRARGEFLARTNDGFGFKSYFAP